MQNEILTQVSGLVASIQEATGQINTLKEEIASNTSKLESLYLANQDNTEVRALVSTIINISKTGRVDKRSQTNPLKNAKISAARSIEWSKRFDKTVSEARERAIDRAVMSADKYAVAFATMPLGEAGLPVELVAYIDEMLSSYNEITVDTPEVVAEVAIGAGA